MKAIKTRYCGPTDRKGARIIASEGDGKRITIGYPHELDSKEAHRKAAETLAGKLDWCGPLVGGWLGKGTYVWVFLP